MSRHLDEVYLWFAERDGERVTMGAFDGAVRSPRRERISGWQLPEDGTPTVSIGIDSGHGTGYWYFHESGDDRVVYAEGDERELLVIFGGNHRRRWVAGT